MKPKTKIEEVVVHVSNPSETPTCKFHEICDLTRKCEYFIRCGNGCGGKVYIWPPEAHGECEHLPDPEPS